jgi:hypothetical protein
VNTNFLTTILAAACLAFAGHFSLANEQLTAGFAQTDITPPIGYRMAGGYSEVISNGVHDPLLAKALVLEQDSTAFAIVVCDLTGVHEPVTTRARSAAEKRTGIPAANIVISATHTHGGAEYWGPLRDIFHAREVRLRGRDASESVDYPSLLVERCAEAVAEAWEGRMPVAIESGSTRREGLAFNRRYHMRDGTVRMNPGKLNPDILQPAGPVDVELPFLIFRRAGGTESPAPAIGSLSVFAMHTAIFGGGKFGADFPGHLQLELQRDFGASFVSIFGEGAAGDINHINVTTKNPDPTPEQAGALLAASLRDHLPMLNLLREPTLAVRTSKVIAPMLAVSGERYEQSRQLLEANTAPFMELVAAWRDYHRWDLQQRYPEGKPLEVQAARLDSDTAIITLPHEVFVELGMDIKAASPFSRTLVVSLANDTDYYIPTRRAFVEGSYEVTTCPLQPGCGELLVETAIKLLNDLKPLKQP